VIQVIGCLELTLIPEINGPYNYSLYKLLFPCRPLAAPRGPKLDGKL